MRYLEVRRHAFTKKGDLRGRGSDLSSEGVEAAGRVGASLTDVSYVVVSQSRRTLETAIAMGFAVDDIVDMESGYVPGEVDHHDQWRWDRPFVVYKEILAIRPGLARFAALTLNLWTETVTRIPDGACALMIGHGGAIEPTLVAAFPGADHASWGGPFSHLEGARVGYDLDGWRSLELRRYRPA